MRLYIIGSPLVMILPQGTFVNVKTFLVVTSGGGVLLTSSGVRIPVLSYVTLLLAWA